MACSTPNCHNMPDICYTQGEFPYKKLCVHCAKKAPNGSVFIPPSERCRYGQSLALEQIKPFQGYLVAVAVYDSGLQARYEGELRIIDNETVKIGREKILIKFIKFISRGI